MRLRYDLVELYSDGEAAAHVVAVARAEEPLDAAQMIDTARLFALPRTVFELPARREDCDLRARIFTPARELPRAAEATLALALLRSAAVRVEEGVTRADAWPVAGDRWSTAAPPPVLGPKDVEDRALAASAVGLGADALDGDLPVRAASCGPNVLILPVRDLAALRRARMDLDAWQRTIEKARHHGAVVLYAPRGEDVAYARCLASAAGVAEESGNGLAACAAANYLRRHGRALQGDGPSRLSVLFGAEPVPRARVTVDLDPSGADDRAFVVTGRGRRIGGGEIVR